VFSFQWPWLALLLPLPWIARYLWPISMAPGSAEGEQSVLLHPGLARIEHAYGAAAPATIPYGIFQQVLLAILWAALVLTMMRPQWLQAHTEISTEGYDLMLAVDVSRSMGALDFQIDGNKVNRLAVVKGVLGRFIEQRAGDRIGMIVFGDEAYMQAPLTQDGTAVRTLLDNIVPRMAGDATAIGDAIGLAVKKLRERPAESRVLILLTDGENTAGSLPPIEAARLAAQENIRIYTIGVGSKGLVPFMEDGRMTMTRMEIDEDLLRKVSAITGGAYFRATDTQALEEIYRQIDALEKTKAEMRSVSVPEPLYRWPLAIALLCLLMLAGLSLGRGQPHNEIL
jgi:Ca-activated chloride channel family protein